MENQSCAEIQILMENKTLVHLVRSKACWLQYSMKNIIQNAFPHPIYVSKHEYITEPIRLYEPTDQGSKFTDGTLIFTVCCDINSDHYLFVLVCFQYSVGEYYCCCALFNDFYI